MSAASSLSLATLLADPVGRDRSIDLRSIAVEPARLAVLTGVLVLLTLL